MENPLPRHPSTSGLDMLFDFSQSYSTLRSGSCAVFPWNCVRCLLIG